MDDYYKKAHTCGPLDKADVVAHTGKKGGAPKTPKYNTNIPTLQN